MAPDLLAGIPAPLEARAKAAATWLRERKALAQKVHVAHHIDADGVSAGAVAVHALRRAGIDHSAAPAKSLDDVHLAALREGGHDAIWFCDFGSTAYMHFPDTPLLVCDHHELVRDGSEESFPHVNPLLDDLPGDAISGAGCAFLVALALDAANMDLAPVALVGGAGDLQDRHGGFHGANASIQDAAQAAGLVEIQEDVGWYGPDIRSIDKFLTLARDPAIPGITGDARGVRSLLDRLGIDATAQTWSTLSEEARCTLRSALLERLLDAGMADALDGLLRPVVRIVAEEPGTPVRELRGFATLLNSTARYGHPEVGLRVAAGDRSEAYEQALGLLEGHRAHLAQAVGHVARLGVQERSSYQFVHVRDHVHDTVVGIVCGMALDGLGLRRDRPLLGLAYTPDGRTKVSSRAPHELTGRIDLAEAMRACAAAVGGQGGGHKGAAGATIPRQAEERFLDEVERVLADQLGLDAAGLSVDPEHVGGATWAASGTGQVRLA